MELIYREEKDKEYTLLELFHQISKSSIYLFDEITSAIDKKIVLKLLI